MAFCGTDHRLTVVLHADAVGYSRLSADDERGAHRRLRERIDLLADLVRTHAGRVVDAEADSLLAEFPTVADALLGATRAQREFEIRNAALPERERLAFRIGINLADVFVDRERSRLFGNGVNVAARLEGLAEPGTVCVSESVRGAAGAALPFVFVYLGEFRLKNIATPVRAYRADPALEAVRAGESDAVANATVPRRALLGRAAAPSLVPVASLRSPAPETGSARPPLPISPLPVTVGNVIRTTVEPTRTGSATSGHRFWLVRWLRWLRRRFGPRRGVQWKLFDFCLAHAFVYSSAAFFVGLVFLDGANDIGALRVSYLEVGSAVRSGTDEASAVAGVAPVLLSVLLVHVLLVRSWRRTNRPQLARHEFDGLLLLAWTTLVLTIAFALGLAGFGAGVVALSVAIAVWPVRGMPGIGTFAAGVSLLGVTALGVIAGGAARGDERLSAIAEGLHGLHESDVDRLLILLLLLPLGNAVFDYLSWRASRRFGLAIKGGSMPSAPWVNAVLFRANDAARPRSREPLRRALVVAHWGAIDLAAGAALLYALAASLGFAFETLDVLRHDDGGHYDLSDVAGTLAADPFGAGFWLSAMLLTTLVPTAFHIAAVCSGFARVGIQAIDARGLTRVPSGTLVVVPIAAWLLVTFALASALLGSEWFFPSIGWSLLAGAEFAAIVFDLIG